MIRSGLTIASLLAVLAPAIGARQEQLGYREADPPDRGTLAVLRRDGLLIPFAAVAGDNWSMYWPTTLRMRDIPITVDAIPRSWWGGSPPQRWRLWRASGASQPLTVNTLTTARVHCAGRLALRTDYTPTESLPLIPVDPFPQDGLAIGGSLDFDPIEQVPPGSPERAALAVALLPTFDRAEDATVRTVRAVSRWRHPVSPEVRRKTPVRIESWYRAPLAEEGWTLSFVEAVRAYPPGPDDEGCGLETLFSGWVYSRGSRLVERADLLARITYCDRVGALYMLPFGRIHVKNRTYWVYQMSGWDQEWYTVARVSRREVRYMVEFPAGSIASCGRPRGG
jgi:hypothetical protein